MDTTPILAQYGALGVMVVFAGLIIRVLFQRTTEAYERERDRADRMEQEVQRLNELIQEKMLPILHDATRAISEALHEQRRKEF
ncbi:hypothetical protein ACFVWG_24075 [Kribbella sp. NPDC058245]|uniref:hypothetical protein n=1 Tax=Kribbella sp. NPDC058245 TaxID=3346399 RepID=UPI0036E78431